MKDRFDLEQEIMNVWNIIEDIDMIVSHFIDSPKYSHMPGDIADDLANKLLGLKEVYLLRFDRLWDTFEECVANKKLDRDEYTESGFRKEYAGPDT